MSVSNSARYEHTGSADRKHLKREQAGFRLRFQPSADDRPAGVVPPHALDVEFAWPIGMPLVRSLGDRLWEVRSNLTGGRISRVIFTEADGSMVLLHGFIKKTRKTPKQDLDLPLKRKKEGGDA